MYAIRSYYGVFEKINQSGSYIERQDGRTFKRADNGNARCTAVVPLEAVTFNDHWRAAERLDA